MDAQGFQHELSDRDRSNAVFCGLPGFEDCDVAAWVQGEPQHELSDWIGRNDVFCGWAGLSNGARCGV